MSLNLFLNLLRRLFNQKKKKMERDLLNREIINVFGKTNLALDKQSIIFKDNQKIENNGDAPFFENELSDSQLRIAIEENKINRDKYGWRKYGNELFQSFGIANLEDLNLNLAELSKKVAEWQIANRYNNANGIIGLWVWSVLQEKLGLHNFSQFKGKIDVEKAIRQNTKYKRELWGKNTKLILEKINKGNQLSDAYFAYAVAEFQSLKKIYVDGSLGPKTWAVMEPLTPNSTNPATPTITQLPSKWHSIFPNSKLSHFEPFLNGSSTFQEMVTVIERAKKDDFIYILGWMLDIEFDLVKDDPSTKLINLLTEADKRKVQIRILIWNTYDGEYQDNVKNAQIKLNKLSNCYLIIDGDVQLRYWWQSG